MPILPPEPHLGAQSWLSDAGIQRVFDAIEAAGAEGRVVGGAVRNSLLQRPVSDIDIATTATPQEVIEAASTLGLKVIPTGVDHGTVTIVAKGTPYEVTTLRQDVETYGRQAKVVFGTDWGADARRRDFTMNALYVDRTGKIFDPLSGLDDCLSGKIRFIGDPEQRIQEDYLRILRFFRIFAEYGRGDLDHAGLTACIRQRDGLRHLSAERTGMEMKRLVIARRAAEVIPVMEDSGLLEITTGGVSKVADFKAFRSLDSEAEETRAAPLCFAVLAGFVDEDLDRIADRFRLSNADRTRMHQALGVALLVDAELGPDDMTELVYRHDRSAVIDGLLAVWARRRAQESDPSADTWFRNTLALVRSVTVPVFPVRGSDLIARGVAPGPVISAVLTDLEKRWIESGFELDKGALLATFKH